MTTATFRTGHEVLVRAPVHRVWRTLTEDVPSWWSTVSRHGAVSAVLEPYVGGRVLEEHASRPWGTVTGWCPTGHLEVRGRMDLPSGVTGLLEVELEETAGCTRLHVLHQVAGPWETARWVRSTDAWRAMAEQVGLLAEQSRRTLGPVPDLAQAGGHG